MNKPPFDQRLAARLVRPLVGTPVSPNHITVLTLVLAFGGCWLMATGPLVWGAALFCLARFLDHFDGELARQANKKSRLGYLLDYLSGGLSYAALFIAMGIRYAAEPVLGWHLGGWALGLGGAAAFVAVAAMALNLKIDEALNLWDGESVGYPGIAGFELEDGIYLLLPVTWAGWLGPFFLAASIGACIYRLWTLLTLVRLKLRAG